MQGRLKFGFNDRGFTFIAPDEPGPDVFVHISQLKNGQDKAGFVGGATVEYETVTKLKKGIEKPEAIKVSLVTAPGPSAAATDSGLVIRDARGRLKFWDASGFGFIVDDSTGNDYYARYGDVTGGYLKQGDQVIFDVTQEKSGDRVRATNVRIVDWKATGDRYSDEIDLGDPKWANTLSELAEKKEDWNYRIKPAKDPFKILRSYIQYTYLRQRELDGHLAITADGEHMAFNTGLVTDFQEEIFAVFSKRNGAGHGPDWVLRQFERASSERFLILFGAQIPPIAWYYRSADQLVYDTSIPLMVNVEHVPHDPDRFPASLAQFSAEDLAGLVNAKAPEAIERVKRNYKTAIPQFYRDSKTGEGKMQLLLPVGLVRRDQVELALCVDRLTSGVYLGKTVLTLDWAYNNARLITRPDNDWLQP